MLSYTSNHFEEASARIARMRFKKVFRYMPSNEGMILRSRNGLSWDGKDSKEDHRRQCLLKKSKNIGIMKETSAHRRLWKMEAKDFVEMKKPFKVFGVTRPEDEEFCKVLIARHGLTMERQGSIVTFSHPSWE